MQPTLSGPMAGVFRGFVSVGDVEGGVGCRRDLARGHELYQVMQLSERPRQSPVLYEQLYICADSPFIPNLERRPYLLMRTNRTMSSTQAKPARPTAMDTCGGKQRRCCYCFSYDSYKSICLCTMAVLAGKVCLDETENLNPHELKRECKYFLRD